MPKGAVFRSRDIFSWIADGGIELSDSDLKPINASGRATWRHKLSAALIDLRSSGELMHPGISRHAWRIL